MVFSSRQKKLALLAFALFFSGLVFAFFLLVAPPLSLWVDPDNVQRVWVQNDASHSVSNVRVHDAANLSEMSLGLLRAGERKSVDIGSFGSDVVVFVEGDFHPTARLALAPAANACPIGFNVVSAPAQVGLLESFRVQLNVCSHGAGNLPVVVRESHPRSLGNPVGVRRLSLAPGECSSVSFSFVPVQSGLSRIQILIDCGSAYASIPLENVVEVLDRD